MAEIQCFLIQPTRRQRMFLRRFHSSAMEKDTCPGPHGYHNAMVPIGEAVYDPSKLTAEKGYGEVPHDDPRWPVKCDGCDYAFQPTDNWQLTGETIYVRGGEDLILKDAPPGAMWWRDMGGEPFYDSPEHTARGGGPHLHVRLPGGRFMDWDIDGPSRNGGGWTRTGEAPNITARPSILCGAYHGWLTDGVLKDC